MSALLGSLCLAAFWFASAARAQTDNGPPEPRNAADSVVEAAIREAKEELESLEKASAEEIAALQDEILEETRDLESVKQEETGLAKEFRQLETELAKVEEKLAEVSGNLEFEVESLDSLKSEVFNQATAFKGRFSGTLLAYEESELLTTAERLIDAKSMEPSEQVAKLLDLYGAVLEHARTVSQLRVPARLSSSEGGEIVEVAALRFGLLGGYYSNPKSTDAGFLTRSEGDASFIAESRGLTAAQKAQIASIVESPAGGGMLPVDVTGGAGLATFQSRYSFTEWFGLGGVFMWPLLAVAGIGLLMIVERFIVLAVKSFGIHRHTNRILDLVDSGDYEAAEEYSEKVGGATGAVLASALENREHGREVMEDAVQEALLHHAPTFHTRLGFIALCAAVAPLMGLLGTVTGMITTFKMVTIFGTADPRFMAGGISEALITTQAGLFVAIPCLLLRGILGAGADASVGKLETGAVSVVLAVLRQRGEGEESMDFDDEPSVLGERS